MENTLINCAKYIKQVCLEHGWAYIPVAICATVASWLGVTYVLVAGLGILFLVDLITGMGASLQEGSKIRSGFTYFGRSIIKFIGYGSLIMVGWVVGKTAIEIGMPELAESWTVSMAFGLAIINEIISILENIKRLGIKLPAILDAIITTSTNK